MAKHIDTTVPPFTEPPTGGLRAMFAQFTALVGSLVKLTDAERDLDGYDGQDPALSAYTGAVDAARDRVLAHCAVLLLGERVSDMDRGLQMVTQMVRTAVTTDKAAEVALIRNLCEMREQTVLFRIYNPGKPGYDAVMDKALDALSAYAAGPGDSRGLGLSGEVSVAHSAMSLHFNRLLGAMEHLIHAEQAIQRRVAADVLCPRFGTAMNGAEAALTAMQDRILCVLAADLTRDEDRRLWELGFALRSLLDRAADETQQGFFDLLMHYQEFFMVSGGSAVTRRTREMQARYFQLLQQMMKLDDFGGPGPGGDGAFGPDLAA
ncbi:hypothetical protein [Phaeovulum veldkampii]|uniref:Uncharacterized protein n=1 Tax=Phaeovulum veldkampii DSM 11550 TaxID=1185920 RepID=A0A2T4JAH4_9RHOB|nr:hypothetical protein [Phaeovulum veldkampii]PTE14894.1 hypothetical protein C5F46_14455 [Phaeovulum veldkampii DSM 11550]TDQ53533.1 hypothetical protein EV658_1405 [Phaeovulum veldkampii DSM 11550]